MKKLTFVFVLILVFSKTSLMAVVPDAGSEISNCIEITDFFGGDREKLFYQEISDRPSQFASIGFVHGIGVEMAIMRYNLLIRSYIQIKAALEEIDVLIGGDVFE
jgi:hypothetical protein